MPAKPPRSAPSSPVEGQPGLFVVDSDKDPADEERTGRRKTLRHERALNKAIGARGLDERPALFGAITLARALAAQLDVAERRGDPFATSQIARPFHEVLKDLGLIDDQGGNPEGGGLLDGLGAATVVDAEDG